MEDKQGGNIHSDTKILIFQNFVNNLNLLDLGFKGLMMTWNNMRD